MNKNDFLNKQKKLHLNEIIKFSKYNTFSSVAYLGIEYIKRDNRMSNNTLNLINDPIELDSIIIVLQSILKYGIHNNISKLDNKVVYNLEQSIKKANFIHTNYLTCSYFMNLYKYKIKDNQIKFLMGQTKKNFDELNAYQGRLIINNKKKRSLFYLHDGGYYKFIKNEFKEYSSLFEKLYGANLDTIIQNFQGLEMIYYNLKEFNNLYCYPDYDDFYNYNLNRLVDKMILNSTELVYLLELDIKIIDKYFSICFEDLNLDNIDYDDITSRPIIKLSDNKYIVLFFLIQKSFILNFHYNFLKVKDKEIQKIYKPGLSNELVNKISKLSKKYGFIEYAREVKLKIGKREIGDIDLILKRNNKYLLIECKNERLDPALKNWRAG